VPHSRTLLCSCLIAGGVSTAAKSSDLDDPTIQRTLDLPPPASGLSDTTAAADRVADALDTEIGRMLAAVTRAGVSSPGQMAGILQELRVESAAHLGRLDFEEMSELMTTMRGAGVALGDRNKLRLLARESNCDPSSSFGSQGVRRAQQGGHEEESVTNTQLKAQAQGHAETAQPSGGQASNGSGISSDSAPLDCRHSTFYTHVHASTHMRAYHILAQEGCCMWHWSKGLHHHAIRRRQPAQTTLFEKS
jgi:hypothetical protein